MRIRPLVLAALASVAVAVTLGLFLMRAEAKPAQSGGGLQARVAAQGKLINELQARVAALEHGSSTSKTAQLHVASSGSGHSVRLPGVTHKMHLTDLTPGLKSLTARHAQFIKLGPIRPIYTLPTQGPTALQQLTTQVAALTQQLNSLQTEIGFDENLLGEEINYVQKNLDTVSAAMPVMPPGQGFCGGNGAMTWGSFKYYLNNSRADNDLICYLAQP